LDKDKIMILFNTQKNRCIDARVWFTIGIWIWAWAHAWAGGCDHASKAKAWAMINQ
jgi:hypothetical protein